ncbi:MAG: hypothetical protein KAH07_00345, partial [Flavobacteriaceae bacterium]|nr:hypothetical protein [Flavobacteriaceae bacterium]
GDIDILINSKNAAFIENIGGTDSEVNFKLRGNLSDKKLAGHTTSPTFVNWDQSGKPDLLLGAEDGCFYYWKND